ncbi:hypothetical protein NNO07_22605 [Pseudomonas resinovorans]|uniref:Rha family transcriptional regulator n=1 Tax=Metapseudomonas resinovorans TaxID=53412 RepID=A0ABT4YAG4_METRE|nr:phage regulatory CII family protein [Pseudomonas resinovorans]MDA8485868.1 hypothetical protein [Pseudomonas resinovorans]
MQELMRAIYDLVDEHGATNIAKGASFSSRTLLSQKANPDYDSHKMNVEELHRVMAFTQDIRPLRAWAELFGFELVAKEKPEGRELVVSMMAAGKEFSELTLAIHGALEDSRVTQVEKAAIRREIAHVRESLDVMEESVKVA